MQKANKKVTIIGGGRVGMTAAYTILLAGIANEIVILGRNIDKLVGEQLDLEHGLSFLNSTKIKSTQDYRDIKDSDVVIIAAGAKQNPGETRLDLTEKNSIIIEQIIPRVIKYSPQSIILIVTNPVDILTYKAYQLAKLPKGRIFGTGTVLDTARFRFHLSEFLDVNPKSIHAYILGEHGDSSFPAISSAQVGGQLLSTFPNFSEEKSMAAYNKAKEAAYEIIESKGSTYYGIGVVINHIVKAILRDAKSILPVSIPLHHYYEHDGVSLSVPCVVGRSGVEKVLEIKLSWEEKQKLASSVKTLKSYL